MTNVLNSIIANQPINKPAKQVPLPSFTFNSEGKVKPMKDKGHLLPSRIFGSPIEYAKDLKKDIVSIGKAAKGQANDHELGRINDLAMKLGSLGLASYLFVKNPLKLSKAMEFAGFGTFFASMALWPKLAIQAPIKARTGVDIHQKYIDSQGRKKMLHQDPQYVLTDLYSREELDTMGKKLKVSENLPDRDNFIKQRAQKTAIQGNTLWMMTAGIATPVMSALACNRLEKPLGRIIEQADMITSENALHTINYQGTFAKFKQTLSQKSFEKFLSQNGDKALDDKMIKNLASKLGGKVNSAALQTAIEQELSALKNSVRIDETFVKNALSGKISETVFASLSEEQKTLLDKAMNSGSLKSIADTLSKTVSGRRKQEVLSKELLSALETAKKSMERPTVSQAGATIKKLYSNVIDFSKGKNILDKYINARVGDKAGTYIANQWGRVGDKVIKSLKLSNAELKAVAQGNTDVLTEKLMSLASDEAKFDKVIKKLTKLIGDYENVTGSDFTSTVQQKAQEICTSSSRDLQTNGFVNLAGKISSAAQKGTVENLINVNTAERISGAQSSFYRLLQSLDLFKKVKDGSFEQQLKTIIQENGLQADKPTIDKLTKACQKIVLNATTTDYVEKLKTAGFNLSEAEYKTVMKALFDGAPQSAIEQSLTRTMGADKANGILTGFKSYKREFMNKVANWQNNMTTELSRRTVDGVTQGANAAERNNLAGKSIKSLFQDVAKQTYNSNKWLKIFGGTMLALTAVTLVAGLAIGRKGKTEKQVEAENKVNG